MKFQLGQIVATKSLIDYLEQSMPPNEVSDLLAKCIHRHVNGDWGCVSRDDGRINDMAISLSDRILSSYPIDASKPCKGFGENCIWVITEADRSVTTLLLPDDY